MCLLAIGFICPWYSISSVAISVWCLYISIHRIACGTMVLGDSGETDEGHSMSGGDKRKRGTLAPWDLPAAKLLRLGRKSSIEDAESYEQLWAHLSASDKRQDYGSELCSDDPVIRGVAISRYAEGWTALCTAILDTDKSQLKEVLNKATYEAMESEAKTIKEKLSVLNGSGLPVRQDGTMKKTALGGGRVYGWKDENAVKEAMQRFLEWCDGPSRLRKTVRVLQLGGLFYTCHVDHLCFHAYRSAGHGKAPGTPAADAVARLCQAPARAAQSSTPIRTD